MGTTRLLPSLMAINVHRLWLSLLGIPLMLLLEAIGVLRLTCWGGHSRMPALGLMQGFVNALRCNLHL
jgi:hypothetical protein